MPKLRVRAHRDDDLRTRKIEIWKGRKKVTVKYNYSPAGDVFDFSLEGRRELLPSVPQLLQIVDAKRLDRIGTIELIDLITRIALIDEITTIGTIGEITTLRDLTWSSPSIFVNFAFHQGLVGWESTVGIEVINGQSIGWTGNVCHFMANDGGKIEQMLGFGFDPAWATIKFWMRSTVTTADLLRARYHKVSDGTTETEYFKVNVAGTWELKTMSPTVVFNALTLQKMISAPSCWIGHIFMVF